MRIAAVLLALVAGIVVGGCAVRPAPEREAPVAAAPAPAPVWATAPPSAAVPVERAYVDAQRRFSLVPPPGWKADTPASSTIAVAFHEPALGRDRPGSIHPVIAVYVRPRIGELTTTAEGVRQSYAELPGVRMTADEPTVLASGGPAQLFGATYTDTTTGEQVRDLKLVVVGERNWSIVHALARADDWAAVEADVLAAVRTMQPG